MALDLWDFIREQDFSIMKRANLSCQSSFLGDPEAVASLTFNDFCRPYYEVFEVINIL